MALVFHFNHGVPLGEYPQIIQQWIQGYGIWGGVVYVVIYIIRPLVFFPATLLTAVSGLIFGPWCGLSTSLEYGNEYQSALCSESAIDI